jgi:hypothetical protein
MSHRRQWEEDDRHREKEVTIESYTSGIWELDEELKRSYPYYYCGGLGLWHGGCRAFPYRECIWKDGLSG